MSNQWKHKHLNELKAQRNTLVQQIELDKKCYAENIEKLKDMSEVIEKLEDKKEERR